MRQCYEWRKSGVLPLAVNLSTRNLLNQGLPELIIDAEQPQPSVKIVPNHRRRR